MRQNAAHLDGVGTVPDMRVAIAPVTGCFTSGLSTLLDVLQMAEGLRRRLDAQIPGIEVEILGVSDTVVTRHGLSVEVKRRIDREGCGTFVLAQSGLLDGHAATTSWFLTSAFQRRYPLVGLDMSRMVVHSGRFVTAGAGFAHIDLALSLVSGLSRELAAMVARYMLIDERPSPSLDAAQTYLGSIDGLLTEFETWVRMPLAEPISIADAAASLGTTRK